MIWFASVLIVISYALGKYQGWGDGVRFAEVSIEHYLVARKWGTYKVVNDQLIFEVHENGAVDSNSVGKDSTPIKPAGG